MTIQTPSAAPLPTWPDFVVTALQVGQETEVPRLLDVVAAIDEAFLWLTDRRRYVPRFHQPAWISCFGDAASSLGSVGPRLADYIESERAIVVDLLARLPGDGTPSLTDRRAAAEALRRLQELVRAGGALTAGWEDLLAACQDPARSVDDVLHCSVTFLRILQLQGRNVSDTVTLLRGVLVNGSVGVAQVKHALGQPIGTYSPEQTAGLTEDERVALCTELLEARPTERHHVVWVAFDRARLTEHPATTVGAISFYDATLVRELVEFRSAAVPIPPELLSPLLDFHDIMDSPHVVLARVDLGVTVESDPPARAALIAETVVAAAALTATQTTYQTWVPMDGFIHAVDDQILSVRFFVPRNGQEGFREAYDLIGRELLALHRTSLDQVPIADVVMSSLRSLRWYLDANNLRPSPRLLLDVSVLELRASTTPTGTPRWWQFLTDRWKDDWIRDRIRLELATALRDALRRPIAMHADMEASRRGELDALLDGVVTPDQPYRWRVEIGEAVRRLPDISALFSPYSWRGRRLRTIVSRTASMPALAAWVDELDSEWDVLCARAQRSRNTLTHGGPMNDRVVASASAFIHLLTSFLLYDDLEALLEREGAQPDDRANYARRWRGHISGAPDVATALEGPGA